MYVCVQILKSVLYWVDICAMYVYVQTLSAAALLKLVLIIIIITTTKIIIVIKLSLIHI